MQQIPDVRILSPELVEVVTKRDDQDPEKSRATNVFIAAFTTCQARLKLYESLEILKDLVLYYDTDSVVYKWKPGESEIALGVYLGDMTNELDEGDYIVEFITAGAKNCHGAKEILRKSERFPTKRAWHGPVKLRGDEVKHPG